MRAVGYSVSWVMVPPPLRRCVAFASSSVRNVRVSPLYVYW